MKNEERWVPVPGYEGYYEVANTGRVRSVDRTIRVNGFEQHRRGRLLKASWGRDGYLKVTLCREGRRDRRCLHELVAEMFLPPASSHEGVVHIDGDRLNNAAENLVYKKPVKERLDEFLQELDRTERVTLAPSELLLMRSAYEQGTPLRKVAERFHVSENRAWNAVRHHGKRAERF